MIYALDTNIVVRYLRHAPSVHKKFADAILRGDNLVIPRIVDYEIMRGFRIFNAPAKESAYKVLITTGFCQVAEPDVSSWERAASIYVELYHKKLTIGELDILIAALCIENDLTLVTNNVKHFEIIDGLKIENWTIEDRASEEKTF